MYTSLSSLALLAAITVLYAGYNVLVKVSGAHVPAFATTTILATICLQVAALIVSVIFLIILSLRGGHTFQLSKNAYLWAVVAGLCIGLAEIGYFYLFSGVAGFKPMAASRAVPVIVSGTILLAMLFSVFGLKENIGWSQVLGGLFIVCGIVLQFINTR